MPGAEGLPAGTVTFVLGDVVGSTRLWEEHDDIMPEVLARLDAIVDNQLVVHRGARPAEQGEGDNVVAVFVCAADAVGFAWEVTRAIAAEAWPGGVEVSLRIALHTGEARARDGGRYMGESLNRCARLRALGHGGQVLLSRATADLVVDHLCEGAFLRDLGVHHLRDLTRPERVAQLCAPGLPFEFPPLRSMAHLPTNLPMQVTTFVGRARELSDTATLLAEHRLLTLTGAGGCGKTRLAVQLAAELVDRYPDGVWLADLSPLTDGELVGRTVAAAAGCPEVPGQRPVETLVESLRDRELLIVVDNCEHLLDAAAEVAEAVLAGCPGVRILATSREPLTAAGEVTYRVPSLAIPAGGADADCDSVRLFADRAALARPGLQIDSSNLAAVTAICGRLDGIPLAIELAAARCRVMTAAQIEAQLADRFRLLSGGRRAGLPRQRTLDASVEWSYHLLSEDERRLLRLLSVFAGGFTLDGVEACWDHGADERVPVSAVDLLAGLVDKSLVQPPDADVSAPRFRLLETIRQYAVGKLVEAGEAPSVRQRHAEYYAQLAEAAFAGFLGPDAVRWLAIMTAEVDNLRAADDWAAGTGQADIALRLCGPEFWPRYGALTEGQQRQERALTLQGAPPKARAAALLAAAETAFILDELERVIQVSTEAISIAGELGDADIHGQALNFIGWCQRSPELIAEALKLLRTAGSDYWAARALCGLGLAAFVAGDRAATSHFDEALRLSRAVGSPFGTGRTLVFAGVAAMLASDFDAAEAALTEGRVLMVESGDKFVIGLADAGLAWLEAARGDGSAAIERCNAALEQANQLGQACRVVAWLLWARSYAETRYQDHCPTALDAQRSMAAQGNQWAAASCEAIRAEDQLAEGDAAEAAALARAAVARAEGSMAGRRSLGRALLALSRVRRADGEPAAAEAIAHRALAATVASGIRHESFEILELIAGLATEQSATAEAARLFAAAAKVRTELGYPISPREAPVVTADLDRVRRVVGNDFEAFWKEGSSLDFDEAVAYATRGRGTRKRPSSGWGSLSPTERAVVRLVADGLRNKEVAAELFISPATVKTHLAHAFTKLGVTSRAGLAALATRRRGDHDNGADLRDP